MPQCSQNIYVFQPQHDDTRSSCLNNIASKDVVFKAEFCGIKLTTLDFNIMGKLQLIKFQRPGNVSKLNLYIKLPLCLEYECLSKCH
jgi:hypothetical protein